jgi:hypothetical protein
MLRAAVFLSGGLFLLVTTAPAQEQIPEKLMAVPTADSIGSHPQQPERNLVEAPIPKVPATTCSLACRGDSSTSVATSFRSKPKPNNDLVAADKKFWFANGAVLGAAILQTSAVAHCRHTVGRESCVGRYGDFIAMQSVNIITVTGTSLSTYWWKKADKESGVKHSSWWLVPFGLVAFNGYLAAQQYRKHCPAGKVFNGDDCE